MLKKLNMLKTIQDISFELDKGKCFDKKKEQLLQNCSFFYSSDVYMEIVSEIVKCQNVIIIPVDLKSKKIKKVSLKSTKFREKTFATFSYILKMSLKNPNWTFFLHSLREEKSGVKFAKLYIEDETGKEVKVY